MRSQLLHVGTQGAVVALLLAAGPASASVNPVTYWNELAAGTSERLNTDPVTESRIFAILQIAVHDALNAIDARYQPYHPGLAPADGASPEAAVAAASHGVLLELLPESERGAIEAAYRKALNQVADKAAGERGAQVGHAAAIAVLALRKTDGADRKVDYTPGSEPGAYRPTPPKFIPAFMPQWGDITPFSLQSSSQFRPSPPPPARSDRATCDLDEVLMIGGQGKSERSSEQSEIARFWYEHSTQGWNRIARNVAQARKLDTWQSARLLALVNIAMADGLIAGFEAKYHYNYWRPVTAINAGTHKDWLSYLETPPAPDYPSTHTVLGAAAAAVLARFFECDYVPFSMTSGPPYAGITRKFWSFSEAAHENGASRVLCGIHFTSAVKAGFQEGDEVGNWVFDNTLRPVEVQAAEPSTGSVVR